jgi:hypothetical protein
MPFSPSDFEWWMWLLFGVGAYVVSGICYLITVAVDEKNWSLKIFFGLITFAIGLGGTACFLVALIRFVKWVWVS